MGMDDASAAQAPMDMPPMEDQQNMDSEMMDADPNAGMPQIDMGAEQGVVPEDDKDTNEISSLIDQLSIEDKAAAKKYIESMINKSSGDNEEGMAPDTESVGETSSEMPPMMESVIITKRQHEKIMETFSPSGADDNDERFFQKPKKNQELKNKSPFNAPKFD